MYDINEIRKLFPMLQDKKMQGKQLVFLDNSSTTFKPQCVIDAVSDYYTNYTSNSHRGDYDLMYHMDTLVHDTRKLVSEFINSEINEVVFTSGATFSLNQVAFGYGQKVLSKGDVVLLSESEHGSNVLPWMKVCEMVGATIKYIPLDEKGRITVDNVKKVIDTHVKIISIAHVSNVLGFINDVKSIAALAHSYNAVLCVDGSQSVPHLKTDFKDLDADFLCFSSHKMCGPTGVGVLVGKYHLLDMMDPLVLGGSMNETFNTSNEYKLLPPPSKFEGGTQNLAGIVGFKAAIEFYNKLGIENIRNHEIKLREYAINRLKEVDNLIIYNKDAECGIITFNVKDVFAQDEVTLLNYKGIAIRSGQHCAKLLNDYLGTYATCRMSIGLYTSKEEIDIFVNALKEGGDILDAFFND